MKIDPAFCNHTNIGKSAKIETVSVPELQLEQLVLKVRIFCKDCKEAFVPKTMNGGFSTDEIGVVGEEVIIPLEYPNESEESVSEEVQMTVDKEEMPSKEYLH
jgi:hypothetical protein